MASSDTHPHILIDVLFRVRKRLDAQVSSGSGRLPLLLTELVPRDPQLRRPSGPRIGFHSVQSDYAAWGPDRRDIPFYPTRLILDWQDRSSARPAKRLTAVRPLLDEATANMRGLIEEAREYFELGSDEPLRIACVGCRSTLFAHELVNDRLIEQAAAPLMKKGSAHYCAQLARALEDLGLVELQWLGEGFPEASLSLSGDIRDRRPARFAWLAYRIRRQLARDPRLASDAGSVSLFYYKKKGLWRRYPRTDASTEELLNEIKAEFPKVRSGVLAVLAARPLETGGCLDNPILTTGELRLAASAGVKSVLLDSRLGLLVDPDLVKQQLPKSRRQRIRPQASAPLPESLTLPPVYPL